MSDAEPMVENQEPEVAETNPNIATATEPSHSFDEEAAWKFLRSEIPDGNHKRELPQSVYKVAGLTDVADWYLWQRLERSGLRWELADIKTTYMGTEQRTSLGGNSSTWYLFMAEGTLVINGRPFPGVGASENMRFDGALKGALTSLFKNCCKWAGLTMSVYKNGPLDDSLFNESDSSPGPAQSRSATTNSNQSAVDKAVTLLGGKVTTPAPATKPKLITTEEFEANPLNIIKVRILREFNQTLPNPNADGFVDAALSLWLAKAEQDNLTPEMRAAATGGSPANWTFQTLVTMHRTQCNNCSHIQEFFDRLKSVK